MISRRAVEGAIAANSYDRLAIAQDYIDGFWPPPWGFFHGWSDECGDTIDLRGMKDGERPQERNTSRMVFFALGRVVIAYRQLFEEVDGGAFFAAANLPASLGCLPVGTPARVIAGEGKGGHAEDKGIDASVASARCAVDGHGWPNCFVRVPWFLPRARAGLEGRDDAIGKLFYWLRVSPTREICLQVFVVTDVLMLPPDPI